MKNLIIYGDGHIAEVMFFYLNKEYSILAFTNAEDYLSDNKTFLGADLVPFEEIETIYPNFECNMFIAIGYGNRNTFREQRFLEAKAKGYNLISYISPKATYYDTPIGDNCFVFENNVIQPFVTIGNNVLLWSGNHIGHHSTIMDHCFISSHVVVSGNCRIENNCFIGVNATLRDGITIGHHSVIGAGSIVMEDCPPYSVVIPEKSKSRIIQRNFKI